MSILRASLLTLTVLVSVGSPPASAAKFLGIAIGCDKGTEFSYCQGNDLKPSVKRAIDSAVMSYVRHSGTDIFQKGRCEDVNLTAATPLSQCYVDEGGEGTMLLDEYLSKQVWLDKSVRCMPNTQRLVGEALSLDTIPRFDPYTGKERSLTIGEYSSLIKMAGQLNCEQRGAK